MQTLKNKLDFIKDSEGGNIVPEPLEFSLANTSPNKITIHFAGK